MSKILPRKVLSPSPFVDFDTFCCPKKIFPFQYQWTKVDEFTQDMTSAMTMFLSKLKSREYHFGH